MAEALLGNTSPGGAGVQCPPGGSKAVCRLQNTSAFSVTASQLLATWDTTYTGIHIKAVIYADSSGSPGALLATSIEKTSIAAGYNTFTFASPITIAAGDYVWIGVISDTTCTSYMCVASGSVLYNTNTYASGPSDPFGSATTAGYTYPMYLLGDDGQLSIGRSSVNDGSGTYNTNRAHGDRFVLGGSSAVDIQAIHTYVQTTSGSVKCKAAIFTDNAGAPGSKIAQTVEVTGSTANTWMSLSFASPPTITPGTYWLCFVADTNLTTPITSIAGHLWADGLSTPSSTEAAQFTDPSILDANISPNGIDIYATYTLSGVAPSTSRPVCFVCT